MMIKKNNTTENNKMLKKSKNENIEEKNIDQNIQEQKKEKQQEKNNNKNFSSFLEEQIKEQHQKDIYINKLEEELKIYKSNLKEINLRAHAEVENIKKRTSLEIEKVHKFALEKFIHDILPVVDSLERALELADKSSNKLSNIIEGIELTLKVLLNTIKKFGVEVINEINVPFNPDIHEAISMIESKDVKPNFVIMIIQRGYILNGRLLRPAMVTVSKLSTLKDYEQKK